MEIKSRRDEESLRKKYFVIRNVLNTIFVVGAIIGVALYIFKSETTGTYVILGSMVFKMAECCFRFLGK
ncbi:MAG: hypothetical protein MJZ29_06350 [Bacteroidaceae bacterium]|nr:hypothetical protein [Bacteroidaceae bacterium]